MTDAMLPVVVDVVVEKWFIVVCYYGDGGEYLLHVVLVY